MKREVVNTSLALVFWQSVHTWLPLLPGQATYCDKHAHQLLFEVLDLFLQRSLLLFVMLMC